MDLGLITCGEGEDVVGVHTFLSEVVQVFHELLGEEEGKRGTRTAGRSESTRKRSKRREHTHVDDHVDECEKQDSNVSQMCE